MPAKDLYEDRLNLVEGPANRLFKVTPSDTADLPFVTSGIYVGRGGDLAVRDRLSGETVVFENLGDGSGLPIRVSQVLATGTTAAAIVGMA